MILLPQKDVHAELKYCHNSMLAGFRLPGGLVRANRSSHSLVIRKRGAAEHGARHRRRLY
jgi:hypothetical protein